MNSPAPMRAGSRNPTVGLAEFRINVDSTIVNVVVPTLVRELDASTRDL